MMGKLPSGKLTSLWKITIINGKIHYKWPFSIAMLNYQMVKQKGFQIFQIFQVCDGVIWFLMVIV
jgi:hypothetical protein